MNIKKHLGVFISPLQCLSFLALFGLLSLISITPLGLLTRAHASGFTVTNVSFDHTTGNYSFDYTGYTGGNISTESTAIHDQAEVWGYNHQPASCTGGSTGSGTCAGTMISVAGAFTCSSIYVEVYGYNAGTYQDFFSTNPDPSCSGSTPTPTPTATPTPTPSGFTVTNVSFDHTTGAYAFDFSNFSGGMPPSIGFYGGDISSPTYVYSASPASCTGTSEVGHCSGTTSQTSSGAFTCSVSIGVIMYQDVHEDTYTLSPNPDPSCSGSTPTPTPTPTYSITGTVYNDDNHNGTQDTGESGYNGATVTLSTGQTATTNSSGNYTISNVAAGTYTETLTVPTGYSATTTNPATVIVSANITQNFGITTTTDLKITPVADDFVSANNQTANYGTLNYLRVDSSPVKTIFLKYDLSSLSGKTITSVKFKVATYSDANSTTAGPVNVYLVNDTTWGETTLNYNNQPSVSSTLLGTMTNLTSTDTKYSFQLDPAGIQPKTGGLMSIGITSNNGSQLHLYSREATNAAFTPKLVISYY